MDKCEHCHGSNNCNCKRGHRGPRGYQGHQGFQGEQGKTGEKGPKGDHGPRGKQGPPGYNGEQGPSGPRGEQGPKGDQGPRGKQGPPGYNGEQGPPGPRGEQGPKGDQGPIGIFETTFGFAYSQLESYESGNVKFIIAGPLENVELIREGLKVERSGVYQISYKIVLNSNATTSIPSKFKIVINNAIEISSSSTESATSTTLTSTQLFSLLEGDVVSLVAELEEHSSYTLATLQIIQVG